MSAIIGELLKVPQEKGPEVELVVFLDEFYARYENEDGYSAIYDKDLGLFTYAKIVEGEFKRTNPKWPADLGPAGCIIGWPAAEHTVDLIPAGRPPLGHCG